MSKRRVLITGITGQDGSFLADFLLKKGYEVYGLERRSSNKNRINIKHIEDKINFIEGDLTDQNSLMRAIKKSDPAEVYNLAAQSFVGESFKTPEYTSDVTGIGTLRVLEALREYPKDVRFYQASSSEMFGKLVENPANENTPFYPRSPYGVAKLYAHWICKNYRESYGMFNCSGILFNHESERRGLEFVTRKISDGVTRIRLGLQDNIELGNLNAKRDWGYAPDYVECMWLMLQQEEPDDYVLSMGETHSIREFLDIAFTRVGIIIKFKGEGIHEVGFDEKNGKVLVKVNPKFFRPAEVDVLRGDSTKAKEKLGWKPKTSFKELVEKMVQSDYEKLKG